MHRFEKTWLMTSGPDTDLGTSPLVLLPNTFSCPNSRRMGIVTGKSGKSYFLNMDDLGGYCMGPNKGDAVPQVTPHQNSVYAGAGVYPLEGGYIYINVIQYPISVYKFGCNAAGSAVYTKVAQSRENNAFILGVGHGMDPPSLPKTPPPRLAISGSSAPSRRCGACHLRG